MHFPHEIHISLSILGKRNPYSSSIKNIVVRGKDVLEVIEEQQADLFSKSLISVCS